MSNQKPFASMLSMVSLCPKSHCGVVDFISFFKPVKKHRKQRLHLLMNRPKNLHLLVKAEKVTFM